MEKPIVSASLRQVQQYSIRRQGFSPRLADTIPAVANEVFGIYGTAPTCYLSLAARLEHFKLEDLDAQLYSHRTIIRMRAMRGSAFLVPTSLVPAVHQATAATALVAFRRLIEKCGVSQAEYRKISTKISDAVSSPLTVNEIRGAVNPQSPAGNRAFNFIVGMMCAEGLLVRATVRGGWKSNLYRYARFEDWLPAVKLASIEPREARSTLARLYFDTYGPATRMDFAWWSGFSKSEVGECIADISGELSPVAVRESPGEQYMTREGTLKLSAGKTPAPRRVTLLPPWDAYLMAYRSRARLVSDADYGYVYDRAGNSTYVIVIDGVVRGVWDLYDEKDASVLKFALLDKASKGVLADLAETASVLSDSLGIDEVRLQQCPRPTVLTQGANRFLAPLKDSKCKAVRVDSSGLK